MRSIKVLVKLSASTRSLLRHMVPERAREVIRHNIPYAEYRSEQLRLEAVDKFGGEIPVGSDFCSEYDVLLGIIFDNAYTFSHNVAACKELKVPFKVIDITGSDWMERIERSGCHAFMATPSTLLNVWHRMYEERLYFMTRYMNKIIYPSFDELYLWESKRRMRDWLMLHHVPHPRTWVFYDKSHALEFCKKASYPMVFKTDSGASSSGVIILYNYKEAEKIVHKAFSRGIVGKTMDKRNIEWGTVLFQEYIPHDFEWRIVRIGKYFLCRKKTRVGEYASGTGQIDWAEPPVDLLDFAKHVTELGGFKSMALDVFDQGRMNGHGEKFLVNELQSLFGPIENEENQNEHTGRWTYDEKGNWSFEPGYYYQNACANLRVLMILEDLGISLKEP